MNDQEFKEIREKIIMGMELAYERLVEQKKKENGVLVFSQGGKIVRVRARDL